jgi:tetratricopeptide (TPR) repeat protein
MLGILSRHRRREKSWRDASDETNRLWREGLALEQKEEYEEAVTAFQTCTANYEKELGPNQAQTAWSHSHLASACANISRLTQAELHWTKCEAAQAKIFGPMHTHTLQTSANLFQVFARQGKWKEAKQKGKSVLAALEKTEGPNHLSTLKTTLLLGEVYVYFCRYDTALTLHQRAFSGLESTFGPGSSETIWAQYKLANLYDEMGKTTECGKILKQHREICRTTLGVDSEPYMRATWELGRNHRVQGNLVEAETTLTPMLLGSGTNSAHPREKKYLLNSATELVKVYKALGRTAEAREVEKWANGELDVFPKAGDVKTNQDETTSSLPRMGDDEEVCSSFGSCKHWQC